LVGLDRRVDRWVVHHRAGVFDHLFVWVTYAGKLGLVWVGIALVLALLWRRPGVLLLVVGADLSADACAYLLKLAVDRPRPFVRYALPKPLVANPHDSSFPSGHSATSFACATVLTALAPRLAPVWVALAAAVAFSRVYVGVHYPLDVIAGAGLGVLVGAAWLLLARAEVATALRTRGAALRRSRRSPRSG
jgi:undecaprenyl-diphosphatase